MNPNQKIKVKINKFSTTIPRYIGREAENLLVFDAQMQVCEDDYDDSDVCEDDQDHDDSDVDFRK